MKAIHLRARRRRDELKMTQRQVANLCNVTQQAYEKFERGDTKRPRYIYELAKSLKVSAEWLLTGKEEPSAATLSREAPHGSRKIPVYSFGSDLKSFDESLSFDNCEVIDRVAPLPSLENTPGAVALLVQGDDLGLTYPHGTLLYIDRHKYPSVNQPCLCRHGKGVGLFVYHGAKAGIHKLRLIDSGKLCRIKDKDIKAICRIAGILYA